MSDFDGSVTDAQSPALLSGLRSGSAETGSGVTSPGGDDSVRTSDGNVVVDQADLYRSVFLSLDEEKVCAVDWHAAGPSRRLHIACVLLADG